MAGSHWKDQIIDKRKRQEASIPKTWLIDTSLFKDQTDVSDIPRTCGLLNAREIEITETSDVGVLLQKIANAEWSSVEVTTAFCKRAIVAHQVTNCLTEIFIDQALERAEQLDSFLRENGRVVGPLHGLPISLKDQICIKGLEATIGYAARLGNFAEDDAVLVKLLLKCGAIPYVKTNVPQTIMWGETNNNIFGRTVNPFNTSFTPGGSSGGEGALIAMKGSMLGAASDIGGSIRLPSHFCGVYGFKPSSRRVPTYGTVGTLQGQESVPMSFGPLSSSLSGITTFMRAILGQEPWRSDPTVIHKPWNEDDYALSENGGGKQLCIGVMWDEGSVKPHPPVRRALEETKKALERAGHKVIEWKQYKNAEIVVNARTMFFADGGQDFKAALTTGEPLIYSMTPDADQSIIPPYRQPRPPLSAYDLWQLHQQQRELRKGLLDQWEATASRTGLGRPIDALICPPAPFSAVPHGESRSSSYTVSWSSMDYPALIMPVTRVDPALDVKVARNEFLSPEDENIDGLYDAERFKGMPVGIQVIGRPYRDEAVLAIGEIIEKALKS